MIENDILAVPGFGPAMAKRLLDWRQSLERGFRFDPTVAVDPAIYAAMEQRLRNQRIASEKTLTAGVTELTQLKQQRFVQLSAAAREVDSARRQLLQAQSDFQASREP